MKHLGTLILAVVITTIIALSGFSLSAESSELKGPAEVTIGNHTVPSLACHEDQAIWFVGGGSDIGCVNIDSFGVPASSVGNSKVLELHCREDELIGYHGVPDDIACVHIDWLFDNHREG